MVGPLAVKPALSENIKVVVRVRPLLARELSSQAVAQVSEERTAVRIETGSHNVNARFDSVLPMSASQEEVYAQVQFVAESVMQGLNGTIFAYGQTGSGKSYTMFGPEDDLSIYGSEAEALGEPASATMGVIPRAIREVLRGAQAVRDANESSSSQERHDRAGEEEEVSIFCSFLQIYNDQAYDLLRDPQRKRALQVHENSRSGEIYVVGLSEFVIHSLRDCLALLEQGDELRACRQTAMNDVSSRSHSIFQMAVERRRVRSGRVVRSKLNLVDLAGSEKWGSHEILEKGHISEMTNINSSLHTLGRCIAALTDPDCSHVPFRDSKLTRILMDALGGNSRTCVIATLSPSEAYVEETISTLKFADCAKRVMQHARVVETREVTLELVERLEREVAHLRGILATAGLDPGAYDDSDLGAASLSAAGGDGAVVGLEKKLFEANERVRRLEAHNKELREGGGHAEGAPGPAAAGLLAGAQKAAQTESEARRARSVLVALRAAAHKFFHFEMEEEEFQEQFERSLALAQDLLPPFKPAAAPITRAVASASASAGASNSASSAASPRATASAVVGPRRIVAAPGQRAATHLAAGAPGAGPGTASAPAAPAGRFRVRGHADELVDEALGEERPKSIADVLKDKQRELAKHKKLQQYIAEKAQKELERIEAERRRDEEALADKRSRDKLFDKHRGTLKSKLGKLRDGGAAHGSETKDALEEDRASPSPRLPRLKQSSAAPGESEEDEPANDLRLGPRAPETDYLS
jgi:hypothetical protein